MIDTYKRFEYNAYKGTVILALFVALSIKSCVANGQPIVPKHYKGLTASFGTRSYEIASDIPEINRMKVLTEGGNAGIVFGHGALQMRLLVAGFYYSAARVPQTINSFEVEGLTNYYPLKSFNKNRTARFEPYLVTGVSQDFLRFSGHYLNNAEGQVINYSTSREPVLGSVQLTRATVGAGMEWRLKNELSFVNLFAEARYGVPLFYQADKGFQNTTVRNHTAVNVGISFGLHQQ